MYGCSTYDIDTGELLHSLRPHPEDKAANSGGTTIRSSFASKQFRPRNRVLFLIVDGPLDILRLCSNQRIVDLQSLKICQYQIGFLNAALGNKPPIDSSEYAHAGYIIRDLPGALWQPWHGAVENEDEDKLDRQRQAPRDGA